MAPPAPLALPAIRPMVVPRQAAPLLPVVPPAVPPVAPPAVLPAAPPVVLAAAPAAAPVAVLAAVARFAMPIAGPLSVGELRTPMRRVHPTARPVFLTARSQAPISQLGHSPRPNK